MFNLEQQIKLILSHKPISVKDGQLVAISYWQHFLLQLNPTAKVAQITAIHAHAKKILDSVAAADPIVRKTLCFRLARTVVQRYKSNDGLAARLDQYVVKKRAELWPERPVAVYEYQIPSNQKGLK